MEFAAKYETTCDECDGRIHEGDVITRTETDGGWRHVQCPRSSSPLDLGPSEEVCTSCWLVKPCPCEDGL